MADKTQKKTKNTPIVTIDPETLQSYIFNNNIIAQHNLAKSSKKEFFISYLHTKDIISGVVEVSRQIADEDIDEAIELEAYDALGLDTGIEYKIINIEAETTDTKNRLFNVFAFDSNLISQSFLPIKEKTGYIDYIVAAPFLLQQLYEKNMLENDKVDCFVYFQKSDAFFSVYKNGQFVYTKSLNYSLLQINEKFCELMGERVDEEEFYKLLATEGLATTNADYQQYLMQLFGEVFLYINDVIVFFKRSYNIDNIDTLYIGSEIGNIAGVNEYAQSYLGIDSKEFNFHIAKNKNDFKIDQMHVLMILAAQNYIDHGDESLNLTLYRRPPKFTKRPSGMLSMWIICGLLAGLAYPVFKVGQSLLLDIDTKNKRSEYEDVHKKAEEIRKIIAVLDKEKNEIVEQVNSENGKLNFRKKLLNEIHEKKVNYPMKGVILNDLVNLINDRNVMVSRIVGKDKNVTISLRSKNDRDLTELLKDISKTSRYSVGTKVITKDKLYYESNVTTGVLR